MLKPLQQTYKVETELLLKYINSLFPQIALPPLSDFFILFYQAPTHAKGALLTLDPSQQADPSHSIEKEAIFFVHSGIIELHRRSGNRWERYEGYKEGFFSLISLREPGENPQVKLVAKTKSTISIFKIRPPYSTDWLASNLHKSQLLGQTFYFGDSGKDNERKKLKFKEDFSQIFDQGKVRRDTRFLSEGSKNQNIFIISRGEVKLLKQMRIKDQKGRIIIKEIPILYAGEGSVLGGQLFLISSKPVHTILLKNAYINSDHQEEEEEEQREDERRHSKRKQQKLQKVSVEEGGYELYPPHQNLSNFSVVVESANLEFYTVSIGSLVEHISQRQKTNFTRLLEQSYLTLLRRTHEKLIEQLKKQNEKATKASQSLNVVTSQLYSTTANKVPRTTPQSAGISIKQIEVGPNVQRIHQLKRSTIQASQKRSLEKRADLLTKEKVCNSNFKQKIQSLLQKKLAERVVKGHDEDQGDIAKQLAQIFRKNNEGRTEDIERHQELLNKKISLLSLRGGWQAGWENLKGQGVNMLAKVPTEVNNYLKHSTPEQVTFRIKEEYACKIHETNKIKEQFMKIKSECRVCSCYADFEKMSHQRGKSSLTRTAYRTSQGWGRATVRSEDPPLEKVYNQMRFISEKSKQKYKHSAHLLKVRSHRGKLQRRKSAPVL